MTPEGDFRGEAIPSSASFPGGGSDSAVLADKCHPEDTLVERGRSLQVVHENRHVVDPRATEAAWLCGLHTRGARRLDERRESVNQLPAVSAPCSKRRTRSSMIDSIDLLLRLPRCARGASALLARLKRDIGTPMLERRPIFELHHDELRLVGDVLRASGHCRPRIRAPRRGLRQARWPHRES